MNHRTAVENAKMASKLGKGYCPRISLAGACLLARRCPAERWRELDLGSYFELQEPVAAMLRERRKQRPCEAYIIDVLHRDGRVCSSAEAAVMAVERRNSTTQLLANIN